MHVLLYVDSYDVQRLQVLKKYLSKPGYHSLPAEHHVLHLINKGEKEEVHLSYEGHKLTDTHAGLSIELSPDEVCAVVLSHIGLIHSQSKSKIFLQRFYFNGEEYSIDRSAKRDLQVHLRAYWEKIHKAPHIAIARAGSEPIRRLVLHAQENHEVFRVIEEGIKNA